MTDSSFHMQAGWLAREGWQCCCWTCWAATAPKNQFQDQASVGESHCQKAKDCTFSCSWCARTKHESSHQRSPLSQTRTQMAHKRHCLGWEIMVVMRVLDRVQESRDLRREIQLNIYKTRPGFELRPNRFQYLAKIWHVLLVNCLDYPLQHRGSPKHTALCQDHLELSTNCLVYEHNLRQIRKVHYSVTICCTLSRICGPLLTAFNTPSGKVQ